VSQPALSGQIKALEDELGVELFERRPGGMELTSAGRQLLDEARRVIAAAQSLRSRARALGDELQGTVRLGTLADPSFVRLPQVLLGAASRFPLLDVEITHQVTGDAFARVRSGALDASFYLGEQSDPAIEALVLRRVDFVVVAPRSWSARLRGATFADLATHPWILTPPVSSLRVLCDAQFARLGVSPMGRVSADNEQVVRALVVAGVGLALMRDDDARALARKGDVVVWEGETLPCALKFLWHAARRLEPPVHALVELVQAAWNVEEVDGAAGAASRPARPSNVAAARSRKGAR
jgi:DNA-binding transcriptional LysR family regulator